MVAKPYVESFLRINDIPVADSDDSIILKLKEVGWTGLEAREAVTVLRGTDSGEKREKSLFRVDTLSPESVLSLCNIHVHAHEDALLKHSASGRETTFVKMIHGATVFCVSFILAGVSFTFALYILKIGPFEV